MIHIAIVDAAFQNNDFVINSNNNNNHHDNNNNNYNYSASIPQELSFNKNNLVKVIMYVTMFVIGVSGNVPVFLSLIRNRHRKSRIKMMMLHLTIADLIVIFIMLPIEIAWNITVQWLAGDLMCKLLMFFRVFGIYLSSTVLVCFSLDRYFAVLHPLKVHDAHRRGKMMLTLAWMVSFICSVPQTVIFSSLTHPDIEGFTQCVTFAFFSDTNPNEKKAYTIQFLLAIYWIPLMLIVWCYINILREIFRRSDEPSQQENLHVRVQLRRSDPKMMERHRNKTLRLSIVIVLAFLSCWTPFVIINLWLLFDPKGVNDRIEDHVQTFMLVLAGGNSCVNPLIYGSLGHFNSAGGGPLSRCRDRAEPTPRINFLARDTNAADESHDNRSYVFTTHTYQMAPARVTTERTAATGTTTLTTTTTVRSRTLAAGAAATPRASASSPGGIASALQRGHRQMLRESDQNNQLSGAGAGTAGPPHPLHRHLRASPSQ